MTTDGRIIPLGEELPPMTPHVPRAPRNGRATGGTEAKPKRSAGHRAGAIRRRFALLNALIDLALPKLKRTEVAAWLLLYRHAKPDGTVTASVADLARRAGSSERMMRYALERMERRGLLLRIKRGTLAGGPSVWRLLTPEPDK